MDNLLLPSGLLKKLQVTESKDWYILLDTTCTFSSLPFLYERVDNDDTIKKKKRHKVIRIETSWLQNETVTSVFDLHEANLLTLIHGVSQYTFSNPKMCLLMNVPFSVVCHIVKSCPM